MPFEHGRRVSQQALADRIGVHVITVSQWERGKSAPTVANLMAIAEATSQPLEFFTGDSDDDEESEQRMRALITLLMERNQYDLAEDLLHELASGMILFSPTPKFWGNINPDRTGRNDPHGVIYIGPNGREFHQAFSPFGFPMRPAWDEVAA